MPFDELLRRSDIVTVHVPNQPSTNGMLTGKKLFSKEQFDLMQEHAIYISTCRGPVRPNPLHVCPLYGAPLRPFCVRLCLSVLFPNLTVYCGVSLSILCLLVRALSVLSLYYAGDGRASADRRPE